MVVIMISGLQEILSNGFNSDKIPCASLRTVLGTGVGTVTLPSNVDVLFSPPGTSSESPPQMNNYFENVGNFKIRYTHKDPSQFLFNTFLKGRLNSGGQGGERSYAINDAILEYTRGEVSLSQSTLGGNNYFSRFILQQGDIVSTYMKCIDANKSWIGGQVQMYGAWEGWVTSALVGVELFTNPDLTSASGFTGNNATVTNPSPGEIIVTAAASSSSVDIAVSGLTIGQRYRVVIPAKRGAQGTEQVINSINFGTIISRPILLTSSENFVFDIIPTATSGSINVVINAAGAIGDEVVFNSPISIKVYL